MHELSITEHLLNIALTQAEAAQAKHINKVTMRLGSLSGIVEESVRFYLELLARDTIAEGAELQVERVTGCLRCRGCGQLYEPQDNVWLCPHCGSAGGEVLAGRECYLQSIEIETEGG